ncbi:hypothetical protein ABZ467_30720 [Streptomyces sp. NPDC005727]|uniref:hypothetical protein n=1 Tax=Streptomyces sp. NPDC005727 TaxID=3157053 RepID=UPI0033C8B75E
MWVRPFGPPPTSAPRRHAWASTAAFVELWRTRQAITAVPGLGPRPADSGGAAACDDLDARVRALAHVLLDLGGAHLAATEP